MDNGASSYRRFLDGDDNGFAELIDSFYDGLTLYLNTFVQNMDAAEELSENTFVKLITKKPHFSGRSSFKTWLYTIGRNAALDYLRKESRRSSLAIDNLQWDIASYEETEQMFFKEESRRLVHKAMSKLKTEYRQVLWLTYFEEMSIKDTAAIMKKSVNSVEHLVSRARKAIKSEIEKEELNS